MNKKQRPKKSASNGFAEQLKHLAASSERDPEGSLSSIRPLLKSHPDHVLLLTIAGNAARAAKLLDEALVYTNRALAIEPDNLWALRVRAKIEIDQDRHQEALGFLEHANDIYPDDLQVLELLAATLLALDHYDEFRTYYQRLTEKAGHNSILLNNYGHILLKTADIEGALQAMQKGIELDPDNHIARANRIFALHYSTRHTPEDILRECRDFQDHFRIPHRVNRAKASNLQADKKIRIGMISDGFRAHPVGSMITYGLAHVPREQIEFYAYSTNDSSDHVTEKIKALCTKWDYVEKLSADELDQLIRQDEIDILLDLAGFNKNSRIQTIMMEPAPIIVKWVGGLISSTGLDAIDYLLSDRIETPAGADHLYTEKLIRLPDDYICFKPHFYTPPVGELPAARNGYVTFGCFNNISKINDELLGAWSGILNSVPNAHLFLKTHGLSNAALCQRIWSFFAESGINQERIRLEGASPHNELLNSYNDVDIALDPWPYSGGLTTCEALIMGVPVITLPGPTFAGRHSATHLVNAGMPELVAQDWEQYQRLAIGLANDLNSLTVIRENLRTIVLQSPLCDEKRFGQSFSTAMRAIWQRHCEGKPPETLALDNNLVPYFADNTEPVELFQPAFSFPIEKKLSKKIDYEHHNDRKEFRFKFTGRITTIDNGTNLTSAALFTQLQGMGAFHFILFDPAGAINKKSLPIDVDKSTKILPFHVLGNGKKTPLYACVNPEESSTLKPLSPSDSKNKSQTNVIATIPIFTVSIDSIEGLDHIDWLLLNGRHPIMPIFNHANFMAGQALIVQINLPAKLQYQEQQGIDSLSNYMEELGFELYRINGSSYQKYNKYPANSRELPATRIAEYTLLFVPNQDRLEKLTQNEREKIAFIAHTAYGIHDFAYHVLSLDSHQTALWYLSSFTKEKTEFIEPANNNLPVPHTLPGRLVVTLTSYPKRFPWLHLTLRSLLSQTVHPDRLILWIAKEDFTKIPEEVKKLESLGVDILCCEDIRSFKKIVPTLQIEPEAFLVTADDDIQYQPDWLEKLTNSWSGDYDEVTTWRAHKIRILNNRKIAPYSEWEWNYLNKNDKSSLVFPTTGGGTLFPPKAFHGDVSNKSLFMALCPHADDIWFYWMCVLNNKKFRVIGESLDFKIWKESQKESLWEKNKGGGNDAQLRKISLNYDREFKEFMESSYNSIISQKKANMRFTYKGASVFFHLPNKNDHIQKVIRNRKSFYELEMLEDISRRSNPGGIIIDIGANIGNHTIYFGLFCNSARVFAFEPQNIVFNILCENISANDLSRKTKCYNIGLGETTSMGALGTIDSNNLGMTKLDMSHDGGIEITALDLILNNEMIDSKITVIKIDVEGMELSVLKGGRNTIIKHKPYIYAEAALELDLKKLMDFLCPLGYQVDARFNATATYLFTPTATNSDAR